ncbi:MAG: hypothetical protein AAFW70_05145 [Cyanobacteria bacterium J06635_10]
MESRRENLWNLLQIGMSKTDIPTSSSVDNSESSLSTVNESIQEPPPQKKIKNSRYYS